MVEKRAYGKVGEKEVFLFKLDNGKGLTAEIISYGGIVKSLSYKGTDVVLGRDSLEEYMDNSGCFGAIIGRNSNRIEDAEFTLNGKTYTLAKNNGKNNIHGGYIGFDKRVWDAKAIEKPHPGVLLTLASADGDEGFPGKVKVSVTYTLTDDSLKISYHAKSNKDTVVNLTNHTYFNLNGHASGTVDGHFIKMASSFYTPNSDQCMPYGAVLPVDGTPFDMRDGILLADGFSSEHEQITMFSGYDHNFALDGFGFRKFCTLKGNLSGIEMEAWTDRPAVQIYTGNGIKTDRVCKDGAKYPIHGGVCLETQCFPNSLRHSHFPGAILKKGEIYETVTEFKFKG